MKIRDWSEVRAARNLLISLGCLFGVHWEGQKGLGTYGDANRCAHCGADGYGLVVLREQKS